VIDEIASKLAASFLLPPWLLGESELAALGVSDIEDLYAGTKTTDRAPSGERDCLSVRLVPTAEEVVFRCT
jgi:hypothetical protein